MSAALIDAPTVGEKWQPTHPWRMRRNYPVAEVVSVGKDVGIVLAPRHADQLPIRAYVPAFKFLREFKRIGGAK